MSFIKLLCAVILLVPLYVQADTGPSLPEYKGKTRVDIIRVPMRDGTELSVRITKPDVQGKFPAVMIYYPYRMYGPTENDDNSPENLAVPYLAERGYAIVQFDVRGTGNSAGWSKDVYSEAERQDGYDMVEWIAAQSWSNSNVGMMGISYGGVVQWQVAAQAPPHLKAVVVRSANSDVYADWITSGGSYRPYMADAYGPVMTARNFLPPYIDMVGDKWSDIWQERLENSQPWQIGYMTHLQDGPYWKDRSLSKDFSRVKAAALIIGGWADVYPTASARNFANIKSPKHLLIGPWRHIWPEQEATVPGPRIDSRPLVLEWFDHWLKGIDNGVMKKPPVTIFVQKHSPALAHMNIEEPGQWRMEENWPIARAQKTPLYLQSNGKLSWKKSTNTEKTGDKLVYDPSAGLTSGYHWGSNLLPWGTPIDQRGDYSKSLVYTTDPLEEDMEVTGNPQAVLYASSTADVAYFRVKLIDVAPDGSAKLVRYGGLNATHRNSSVTPEALVPDKIYELKVDIKAMAYVFEKGHRIQVAIANADILNAWPTAKNATNTVYNGQKTPSHIILPLIPLQNPKLPAPEFTQLPNADPKVIEDEKPAGWSYKYDYLNRTVTVLKNQKDYESSEYTVSLDNPAMVSIKTKVDYTMNSLGAEINLKADEVTSSDEKAFHYIGAVTITVNGNQFFNKSWTRSVPRILN